MLLSGLLVVASAGGEVLDAAPGGFTLRSSVTVAAPRARVYAAFVEDIGRWWNPDHTVSGVPGALYLEPRPLGCFCESLGTGAGLVHLTVTFVDPGAMLRLSGGLGPLGLMGVAGNLTVEFEDRGDGSTVILEYAVGGYRPDGLDGLAPAVDRVLGEQLVRLSRWVTTGQADAGADVP